MFPGKTASFGAGAWGNGSAWGAPATTAPGPASSQAGAEASGGSYNVWGLPQPIGQQQQASAVLPGLGGGAWGAGPGLPVAPLSTGPSSTGLPPAPQLKSVQAPTLPEAPAASGLTPPTPPAPAAVPSGPFIAKCKGLPFSATLEKVERFFDQLEIVPEGIRMRTNEKGLPTGECYVTFASDEALAGALERNRQVMGHRFVTVERASQRAGPGRGCARAAAAFVCSHPRSGK